MPDRGPPGLPGGPHFSTVRGGLLRGEGVATDPDRSAGHRSRGPQGLARVHHLAPLPLVISGPGTEVRHQEAPTAGVHTKDDA